MMKTKIKKIVLLGAGKLGMNLATAILDKGYEISEVYNRQAITGSRLAEKVGAIYRKTPESLTPDADLYILAVRDSVIVSLMKRIPKVNGIIVHTSGSVDLDVFKGRFKNYGVIWPLQTFNRKPLSFRHVPLCIESNNKDNLKILKAFALSLSTIVQPCTSDERKILHVAAVFASNFTNYMYSIAEELLDEYKIDHRLLNPIIRQTVENSYLGNNFKMQTGPASRGDSETIQKHLVLLSSLPDYQSVYESITQGIIKQKNRYVEL